MCTSWRKRIIAIGGQLSLWDDWIDPLEVLIVDDEENPDNDGTDPFVVIPVADHDISEDEEDDLPDW